MIKTTAPPTAPPIVAAVATEPLWVTGAVEFEVTPTVIIIIMIMTHKQ